MKLPLWIYDYGAKRYILFPYPEMFTTLSDGSTGFKFENHLDNYAKNVVFEKYRHHFEYNPIGWPSDLPYSPKDPHRGYEYRLKRQ